MAFFSRGRQQELDVLRKSGLLHAASLHRPSTGESWEVEVVVRVTQGAILGPKPDRMEAQLDFPIIPRPPAPADVVTVAAREFVLRDVTYDLLADGSASNVEATSFRQRNG